MIAPEEGTAGSLLRCQVKGPTKRKKPFSCCGWWWRRRRRRRRRWWWWWWLLPLSLLLFLWRGVDVAILLYDWFLDWINLWFIGLETSMLIKSCSLGPNMLSNSVKLQILPLFLSNFGSKIGKQQSTATASPTTTHPFKSPQVPETSPEKNHPAWTVSSRTTPMQPIPWCNTACCSGKVYGGFQKNGWWYTVEDAGLCKLCTYVRSLHHDRNKLEEFGWNRIFDATEWSTFAFEMPIGVADFNTNQASANRTQSWRTTLYELWPFPGNLLNRGKLPI